MSFKGIRLVADVYTRLQEVRQELLKMGTPKKGKVNKQDILLSHLVEEMKDATKVRFAKITTQSAEDT